MKKLISTTVLVGLMVLQGCSFVEDEKIRIFTQKKDNYFTKNYGLTSQELALHTRTAGSRLSFIAKTDNGAFLGCIEPSPDALTAKSLNLTNDLTAKAQGNGEVTSAQMLQMATAMQLATYRSQGLQLYRDIKMNQCIAMMNLLSLNKSDASYQEKLNTAIENYLDDKAILDKVLLLMTEEMTQENKKIELHLHSVTAPIQPIAKPTENKS